MANAGEKEVRLMGPVGSRREVYPLKGRSGMLCYAYGRNDPPETVFTLGQLK
jgi:hypothetical protein